MAPAESVWSSLARLIRTRHVARRAWRCCWSQDPGLDPETRCSLATLYRALRRVSGAEVLVDSSKLPSYGQLLRTLPGLEATTVHLVRDPRAVAFSWMRKRFNPATGSWMDRHSALRSAVAWLVTNLEIEILHRGSERPVRILYEDFVSNPEGVLQTCLRAVKMEQKPLPLRGDAEVELSTGHTLAGNPLRFAAGPVRLREDDEWRQAMRAPSRWLVTALTMPLLRRYGYRLLGRAPCGNDEYYSLH